MFILTRAKYKQKENLKGPQKDDDKVVFYFKYQQQQIENILCFVEVEGRNILLIIPTLALTLLSKK